MSSPLCGHFTAMMGEDMTAKESKTKKPRRKRLTPAQMRLLLRIVGAAGVITIWAGRGRELETVLRCVAAGLVTPRRAKWDESGEELEVSIDWCEALLRHKRWHMLRWLIVEPNDRGRAMVGLNPQGGGQ